MTTVKQFDTHPNWKHLKSGKLYRLMGYGKWAGSVLEQANDNNEVIIAKIGDGFADYQVVPSHYTISNVKSADLGIMQTKEPLKFGDEVVVYVGDHYEQKDRMYARREADFFDGRFVKVDEAGNELDAPKAAEDKPTKSVKKSGGEPAAEAV